MTAQSRRDIRRKLKILERAEKIGNVRETCRYYGIVYISVASMRREPSHSAELVNQTVLGTVLKLYKREGSLYYVQNWDSYLG